MGDVPVATSMFSTVYATVPERSPQLANNIVKLQCPSDIETLDYTPCNEQAVSSQLSYTLWDWLLSPLVDMVFKVTPLSQYSMNI